MKDISIFTPSKSSLKGNFFSSLCEEYVRGDINCIPLFDLTEEVLFRCKDAGLRKECLDTVSFYNLSRIEQEEVKAITWGNERIYSAEDVNPQTLAKLNIVNNVLNQKARKFYSIRELFKNRSSSNYIFFETLLDNFFSTESEIVSGRGRNDYLHYNITCLPGVLTIRDVNCNNRQKILAMMVVKKEWLLDTVYRLVNGIEINKNALGIVIDKEFDSPSFDFQRLSKEFNVRIMETIVKEDISMSHVDNIINAFHFKLDIPKFLTLNQQNSWTKETVSRYVKSTKAKDIVTQKYELPELGEIKTTENNNNTTTEQKSFEFDIPELATVNPIPYTEQNNAEEQLNQTQNPFKL